LVDLTVGFGFERLLQANYGQEEERRGDTMLFDRQKFVLAVHQALKEHDQEKDKGTDSGGHQIAIDCDNELEEFADRILELMD
jgi:hypothetical protein